MISGNPEQKQDLLSGVRVSGVNFKFPGVARLYNLQHMCDTVFYENVVGLRAV